MSAAIRLSARCCALVVDVVARSRAEGELAKVCDLCRVETIQPVSKGSVVTGDPRLSSMVTGVTHTQCAGMRRGTSQRVKPPAPVIPVQFL